MRKWTISILLLGLASAGALSVWISKDRQHAHASAASVAEPVSAPHEVPAQQSARGALAKRPTAAPARDQGAVFFARWGGGANELGRKVPDEASPYGPMSFAMDGRGKMTVLDGVNGRLVRRGAEGSPAEIQKIDVVNPEDIAIGADGSTAVLDRFQDKAVSVYDETGKYRGKLALEGAGVSDTGSVTGVFVDGSDVYVERAHGPLVKIGDTSGVAANPRIEIPGRPTRDGLSYLKAGIIDAESGRVYVVSVERATESQRFTRELRLSSVVHTILLLDSDRAGTIYFAAEVAGVEGTPEVLLYCLDGKSGAPTGSAVLPANTLPDESFKDFAVLDGGGVMQALRTEAGVSYTRYDCL